MSEEVLSDVHARIDGLKASVDRVQASVGEVKGGSAGPSGFWRTVAGLGLIAGVAALVLALGNRDSASKSDIDKIRADMTTLQQQQVSATQTAQTQVDQAIAKLKAAESGSGAGSLKKQQASVEKRLVAIEKYLARFGGP